MPPMTEALKMPICCRMVVEIIIGMWSYVSTLIIWIVFESIVCVVVSINLKFLNEYYYI